MELRICREHGISHSHYLGGKRRWTQLDRDKTVALALLDLEECPHCHTLREDWVGDDGKPLKEPVWTPDLRFCPGCEESRRADKDMTDQQRDAGGYVSFMPLVDYVARTGP